MINITWIKFGSVKSELELIAYRRLIPTRKKGKINKIIEGLNKYYLKCRERDKIPERFEQYWSKII